MPRVITLTAVTFFLTAATAAAAGTTNIGAWSQQVNPGHAAIGGSVHTTAPLAGTNGAVPVSGDPPTGRGGGGKVSPYPTVPSNSPILKGPTGPDSFWYPNGQGQQCLYEPHATELCVNVVTPGTPPAPAAPPVDPTTLAASAAQHLPLAAGQIAASPAADTDGLTGTASWFWLTPAPGTDSVSVDRGGEHVTVTAAESSVDWSFGDNGTLDAGPGVPYQSGLVPAGAVRHDYQTRCLPGDQGHDPDVLSSCGSDGYTVTATVGWSITYTATGPVARSGSLTSRTTATSMTYPVTEVRGFLVSAGSA